MAWHYGEYACGHEGRVQVYGPMKHRQFKADKEFSKLCPECFRDHLENQNKQAEKKAKEQGLPELEGSEKQVGWANSLRQKFLDKVEEVEELSDRDFKRQIWTWTDDDDPKITRDDFREIVQYILREKKKARYWIDGRFTPFFEKIKKNYDHAMNADKIAAEKKLIEETKIEATVFPKEYITEAAAEINFDEDSVRVSFERNEQFRQLVKSLRYKWTGTKWERTLTPTNGKPEDRAAELGNTLLNAGFPVIIYDKAVRKAAIDGEYEPEHTRWIHKLKDEERFAIKWLGRSETLYKTARSLPGSKWENPFVTVDVRHYREVEEFAEMFDFKFDEKAMAMKNQYVKSIEDVEIVDPAPGKKKTYRDGLDDILKGDADVIDDLRD